jgi:hypothetical protein
MESTTDAAPFPQVIRKAADAQCVDRCDPRKMKQSGKSQEAPMVIRARDVARLLKQSFAGLSSGRSAKRRVTEWRSRGQNR